MDARSADRNLLFGLLALLRGLISPEQLIAAINTWRIGREKPLELVLLDTGALSKETLVALKGAFVEHLDSCGYDPVRGLAALGGIGPVRAELDRLPDADLQQALGHVASPLRPMDDAPTNLPGSNDGTLVRKESLAGSPGGNFDSGGPATVELTAAGDDPFATQVIENTSGGLPGAPGMPTLAPGATISAPRSVLTSGSIPWVEDINATQAFTRGGATVPINEAPLPAPVKPANGAGLTAEILPSSAPAPLRYKIIRPHARGGLGEVFVARDEELSREVALKEIQGRHAGRAESRMRFLLEAEVTGGLEHPGIVPVYGMGQYADGRPFYAMRFIRGKSLEQAVDKFHKADATARDPGQRELELRQLLDRFNDVCNAIAYAHTRGVLHRDIKPANIMLGAFGETLVVDWGLAKPLDRPDMAIEAGYEPLRPMSASGKSETLMGSAMGTPQYMSPEQASGELDKLCPASDVYSLGATLYYLLTGQVPFQERNLPKLLEQVRNGELVRPRDVNRRVPAPLEAICLKAMARLPENRYQTATELAGDLEHWMADEPVSVYREPVVVRLARWSKRHKTMVTGAAVLLITAIAALSVGNVLIKREQRRTEANFVMARDSVDQMLTELGEVELAEVPQMEQVRKKMLGKALEFYQKFLDQRGQDHSIRRETGRANIRLGDILEMLGDYDGAEKSYERAIKRFGELPEAVRNRLEVQADLATARHNLGVLQRKALQFDAAEKNLIEARKIRTSLAKQFPNQPEYERDAKNSVYWLGALLANLAGRHQEAEEAYNEAIKSSEKLASDHPEDLDFQRKLARYHNNRGKLLAPRDPVKAEVEYNAALGIQQPLAEKSPAIAGLQWELARTQTNLGWLYDRAKLYPRAEDYYRHGLACLRNLAHGFPTVPDYQSEMAAVLTNLGGVLAKTNASKESEECLNEAVDIYKKLVELYPRRPDHVQRLAEAWRKLGNLYNLSDKPDEAIAAFRTGKDALEKLMNTFPNVPEYQSSLGQAYDNLAKPLWNQHKADEARACLEKAIGYQKAALEARPGTALYRTYLLDEYIGLGMTLKEMRDHEGLAKIADEIVRNLPAEPKEREVAARLLAHAALVVQHNTEIPEAERQSQSRSFAEQSLKRLREALDKGFGDVKQLYQPDYEALQDMKEFIELRKELENSKQPAAAPNVG